MKLGTMKVQECRGSSVVYIPKLWAKQMNLKKGDKVTWFVDEGDHQTLKLKKEPFEGR